MGKYDGLKASELPVGTLIEGHENDEWSTLYYKDEPGIWSELFVHCGDCAHDVFDDPQDIRMKNSNAYEKSIADELFAKGFRIVSVPYES